MVGGTAFGATGDLRSLADIGLTFGAIGSAIGTTNALTFDAGKFTTALTSNPEGVSRLLTHFSGTPSLDPSSSGSLTGISGTPSIATDSGKYVLTSASNGQLTMTFTPDNGGTTVVRTATISPGEVNTTLIPGMTLTFAGTLIDGTDTINIATSEEGVAKALHEYVDSYTRAGGVMSSRDAEMQSRISAINEQIETMETRVAARRDRLIRQYATLEVTMSRLQQQQAALGGLIQQLAANQRST
jgi:flagellar hook-associated protein 2